MRYSILGPLSVVDDEHAVAVTAGRDRVVLADDPVQRLERDRPYLGAFVEAAIAAGRTAHAWRLPRSAWLWLWRSGYNDDIESLFTTAREAARRAGDERAEGMCLNYLASVYYRRARYDDALVVLTEAIRLRRKVGDRAALSTSLGNLAAILDCTNRWVEIMQMTAEASSAA